MRLVVISGRSGSGKSSALHVLEDLGFYCIDNLPVAFLAARARPPESVSRVLNCFATRTGWRCGSTSTSVPKPMRSVTAAAYDKVIKASRIGMRAE